jgi:uncharacterized protein (DUF58 family)
MDTTELLRKVRKLEIKTKGLTRQMFSGEYHSAFKGRGMSFSEVRDYRYGDDVRNIDWNVTARTGDPHIKIFEEERELTVMLVMDMSGSSFFGTGTRFRRELMTEMAAVIAFSAISNNDKVGALFFSGRVEKFIPPKKGRKHVLTIIRELIDFTPSDTGTNIQDALIYLTNLEKKRSIAFLMSDFQATGYEQALVVAGRKHDIVGIRVLDEREATLPDIGLLRVRDAETGRDILLDTGDIKTRLAYSSRYKKTVEEFDKVFAHARCDTISLGTEEDYIRALHLFFRKRAKR